MAFTIIRCPHCNATLEFKPGPAWEKEEIKASEIFKCCKCGGLISTGNSEWADKSNVEKFGYKIKIVGWVISAIFLGFAAAALLTMAFTEWLEIIDEKDWWRLCLPAFILFASLFVWNTIRNIRNEIKKSLERTSKGMN